MTTTVYSYLKMHLASILSFPYNVNSDRWKRLYTSLIVPAVHTAVHTYVRMMASLGHTQLTTPVTTVSMALSDTHQMGPFLSLHCWWGGEGASPFVCSLQWTSLQTEEMPSPEAWTPHWWTCPDAPETPPQSCGWWPEVDATCEFSY